MNIEEIYQARVRLAEARRFRFIRLDELRKGKKKRKHKGV